MDNHQSLLAYPQPLYLLKVLTGLAVLAMVVFAAYWLPISGASPAKQQWGVGLLLLVAVALAPIMRRVYQRMDELHKLLHKRASMASLSFLTSVSCLVGILQANHLIPLFNQFWTLGLVAAVWGVNLMLADRRFR